MLHLAQISPLVCLYPPVSMARSLWVATANARRFELFRSRTENGLRLALKSRASCDCRVLLQPTFGVATGFILTLPIVLKRITPQKKINIFYEKEPFLKEMNHLPTINFQVFLTQLRYAQITNIVGLSSQVQNTTESEKNSEWKKKPKKMTLKRPSWTKKTKNSTVVRLPEPLPGRNSFSLAVGWAVFAGVRSTERNRSYTWGKRSRGCNFWGVFFLGGGYEKG